MRVKGLGLTSSQNTYLADDAVIKRLIKEMLKVLKYYKIKKYNVIQ